MSELLTALPFTSTDEAELDLARQIQSTFIPCKCYGWPGVHLAARRVAGDGLGGDFHNVISGLDEQYLTVVGTIKGPGLVAAMAKAVLSGAVRKFGPITRSPSVLIRRLERLLGHINADLRDEYVTFTVFLGTVDRDKGILEYCSAGGCRPRIWSRDGKSKQLGSTGPALTGSADFECDSKSLELESLRRLLVCTGGLASAESAGGESFGAARARRLLCKTVNLPAEQQANAILQGIRKHVGPDRVPNEDVTVFVTEFADDTVTAASDSMKARLQTYDRVAGAVPDSSVFLG